MFILRMLALWFDGTLRWTWVICFRSLSPAEQSFDKALEQTRHTKPICQRSRACRTHCWQSRWRAGRCRTNSPTQFEISDGAYVSRWWRHWADWWGMARWPWRATAAAAFRFERLCPRYDQNAQRPPGPYTKNEGDHEGARWSVRN